MKPMIRLYLETDKLFLETGECRRKYFKHDREAATQLVRDAIEATKEDGVIRRIGYEVSRDDS